MSEQQAATKWRETFGCFPDDHFPQLTSTTSITTFCVVGRRTSPQLVTTKTTLLSVAVAFFFSFSLFFAQLRIVIDICELLPSWESSLERRSLVRELSCRFFLFFHFEKGKEKRAEENRSNHSAFLTFVSISFYPFNKVVLGVSIVVRTYSFSWPFQHRRLNFLLKTKKCDAIHHSGSVKHNNSYLANNINFFINNPNLYKHENKLWIFNKLTCLNNNNNNTENIYLPLHVITGMLTILQKMFIILKKYIYNWYSSGWQEVLKQEYSKQCFLFECLIEVIEKLCVWE